MILEWQRGAATVSTDPDRLDLGVIHGFLTQAYWSLGVSIETIRRSIERSIPFGVYVEDRQVGFARVISDQTTFAYLCDVFIVPDARGQGLAGFMLDCILSHPELQGLRTWTLFTRDAHGLYERVGFERGKMLDRLMVRRDPAPSASPPSDQAAS
ncbi:MAG TPA: GNAT family N-acetyltransferase [Ktedonobacterales bacterium]|jgi:GNAT superfamily N-acetyltransferase|nr:GNAT family N-acetyltransferase [Ktedonobacterales bacterium]